VLLARHADSSNFADVIIITTNPNAYIDGQSRLEEDDVGIIVLEVLNGDPNVGDTCLCWPMCCLFYHCQTGTFSVYNHARKHDAMDEEVERNQRRVDK